MLISFIVLYKVLSININITITISSTINSKGKGKTMKIIYDGHSIKMFASKKDTYAWAHKPGAAWPCSQLSGKSLFVELWYGDLVNITVNNKYGVDIDSNELHAFIEDIAMGIV